MISLINMFVFRLEPEVRATFKEIAIALFDYINEHLGEFPPPEKMIVNQVKGVQRRRVLNVSFFTN